MRKLLYLAITFAFGMIGCADKTKPIQKGNNVIPSDSLMVAYDDEMFSLLLPKGWTHESDTCETWGIKHIVDSLGIKSGIIEFYSPRRFFKIRVVKSAMRWAAPNSPVSDWGELSQSNASADSTCIYISDITDSISIDGKYACNYWAAFDLDGDTIVQDQYIVIQNKYDLYYINGIYNYGDQKSSELFYKVLSTIKLK